MTMNQLTPQHTIGEFILERPARSRVFESFGISYCCSAGKVSLADACLRKGLDYGDVLARLHAEIDEPDPSSPALMTLTELADHIEQTHHAWLRTELPRIHALLTKVVRAHGTRNSWVIELQHIFQGLHDELFGHMAKEEQILFPFIRRMESGLPVPPTMGAGIDAPIRCMEDEHQSAMNALAAMRQASGDYTPPPGACNTFRAMLDAMAELETDMNRHVYKENAILFPRAIEAARHQYTTPGRQGVLP